MVSFRVVPTQFISDSELLKGNFLVPEGENSFPGICKFHGLPGSPDQVSGIASRLAAAGFVVLTFDFRGFRSNGGLFSLANEVEDARNAVSYLLKLKQVMKDWVGVYGASYGGAVAVLAASEIQQISPRPVLIITGDADKEIKLDGVRSFCDSAKQPKKLVVIEGADHELTNPEAFEESNETAVNWFKQLKKRLEYSHNC